MYFLQLIVIRILLNLFTVNREFVNDTINKAKTNLDISTGFGQVVLLSWFNARVILIYKKPHWSISIALEDDVIISDRLTNGRWCFNRSTITRLETLFENHYQPGIEDAASAWMTKGYVNKLAEQFSLIDRLLGKKKNIESKGFPGIIQDIAINGVSRNVTGSYLIDELSCNFITAGALTGELESLLIGVPFTKWTDCIGSNENDINSKIQFLSSRNITETLVWSKLE